MIKLGIIGYRNHAQRLIDFSEENSNCKLEIIYHPKKKIEDERGTNIFSDNLELLGNESSVKIYNNVVINYPTGSILRADKIDYDFEKKYFKVSMFDDKRIKMKIFK